MSPVPEPMHGGRGGPGDGEEEFSPPVGLANGPPLSSSDEEADHVDSDYPNQAGYQPLPQEFDDEQDGGVDYSSLSGLMAALNTHGPNVIETGAEEDTAEINDNEVDLMVEEQGSSISSQTRNIVEESAMQRQEEEIIEQAGIWNSSQADRLSLDSNRVEEIKAVMAAFTLPQSAIPPWAQNLSEEDWKNQVTGLLSKKLTK